MVGTRTVGRVVRGGVVSIVVWALGACATGAEPEGSSQAYDGSPDPDDGTTVGMSTFGNPTDDGPDDGPYDPGTSSADGPWPPDLGMCNDPADCVLPAGTCLAVQGECVDGLCQHGPAAPGASCDDGDRCTSADACDGEGVCYGVELDCGAGECIDGECVGGGCPEGFADCNADVGDGCEVELGTDADCGGCGDTCSGAAHATAGCTAGSCQYTCQAPWENCDGDWGNGCEVPVGVEHQCSAAGLDPNGCWTAYCGNSGSADATNFGTYHCMDCATCRVPGAGQCQWCDHASGTFFPAAACFCGTYEDLAC